MSEEKNDNFTFFVDRQNMTKEQAETYDEFIDYMALLYHQYGHLFDEGSRLVDFFLITGKWK